jgi:hypothetical protein
VRCRSTGRGVGGRLALLLACTLLLSGCRLGSDARFNKNNASATREQLAQDYPWLAEETKDWREEVDFSAQQPGPSDLGAFPIGNGYVFAEVGPLYPLGTLDNIIGPEYQKLHGFLGQAAPGLCERGKPALLAKQSVTWVKRAGMVHSAQQDADGLRLDIYDFAPPKLPVLVRVMVAANEGQRTRRGIAFSQSFTLRGDPVPDGLLIGSGTSRVRAGVLNARCQAIRGSLVPQPATALKAEVSPFAKESESACAYTCDIGSLPAGQSATVVAYMAFTGDEKSETDVLNQLKSASFGILKAQYDDCQAFYAQGPTLTCDDARLSDFLDISQHIMRCQQAYEGGYSPMDKYTYTWVRDSNGPIRYMLAAGHYDDVKRHLEYHFKGCCQAKAIGNNLSLNMNQQGEIKEPDWSQVPVERAEVPSFVILQHYWYWRYTGDSDLIRRQWGYLRRCLLGQQVDERGTLPFHGDETYRFPGYLLFEAKQEAPDYVSLEAQSADSAFEYVAAAEALGEMASAAGHADEASEYAQKAARIREATERFYWQSSPGYYAPAMSDFSAEVHRWPFTPIDLRPMWIGYSGPTTQQSQNVLQTLPYLAKPEGTLKMTPAFGYYVPMISGYALYDLACLGGGPAADKALAGLLRAADKAGGYPEMVKPDDKPADAVWGKHRFRPWEGGINAEAVVFYLTGLRADAVQRKAFLAPHLPAKWPGFEMKNLRVGDCQFDLKVAGKSCTLTRTDDGQDAWTVEIAGKPLSLGPKGTITTGLPEAPGIPELLLKAADQFPYGAPAIPSEARTLLVTCSKDTVATYRASLGGRLATLDTKLAFPPGYLRAGLLNADGSRRVDEVILDVSKYTGAFKRAEFWAENGEGGKVLAAFKAAGGKVTESRVVGDVPPPPGGLPGQ